MGPTFTAEEGQRSIEQSVGFGLAHRYRIEIRRALHDSPATTAELSKLLGQPRERLRYHVEELLKDGSLEIACEVKAGNMTQNVYRLTRLGLNSLEDWQKMPVGDRQIECALILQGTWTEALAALWAGKFNSDPNIVNVWNRIPLDQRGRADLADELEGSWGRIEAIEADAASRRVDSGEPGKRYIAAVFGYERARHGAPAPQRGETGRCESNMPPFDPAPIDRSVEEAISRAVGHRFRVEILAALHEGPMTVSKLGRVLGQPIGDVHYHVRQLLEDRAVRVVGHIQKGNLSQALYAYVDLPEYDYEDWWLLSPRERQVVSAVTLRAAMAESLTALWRGKLHSDPRLVLAWKPILLDVEGREALTEEQRRSWGRVCAIESEAEERLMDSGEDGKLHVVTLLGFERSRIK